jgi:hypothetical protein
MPRAKSETRTMIARGHVLRMNTQRETEPLHSRDPPSVSASPAASQITSASYIILDTDYVQFA